MAKMTIDTWAREARQKAQQAIDDKISLEAGDVFPRDPLLRYVVIDGDLPQRNISYHRARLEQLGYRDVSADIEKVIGYTAFVVYAIPIEVYREVIRPERVRRLRDLAKRYGIQQGQVIRPLHESLS